MLLAGALVAPAGCGSSREQGDHLHAPGPHRRHVPLEPRRLVPGGAPAGGSDPARRRRRPLRPDHPALLGWSDQAAHRPAPAGHLGRLRPDGRVRLPGRDGVHQELGFRRTRGTRRFPSTGWRRGWSGRPGAWNFMSYRWNDAGTEAVAAPGRRGGELLLRRRRRGDPGRPLPRAQPAAVRAVPLGERPGGPNRPQGALAERGPRLPEGTENQLAHWSRIGILSGAPAPADAPRLPAAADPDAGTVEQRARAYLEANCGFCHNPTGNARVSGLYLLASVTDPTQIGVCKRPVAAGPGAGGRFYDVVPGAPDASVIPYRMESTAPAVAMPQNRQERRGRARPGAGHAVDRRDAGQLSLTSEHVRVRRGRRTWRVSAVRRRRETRPSRHRHRQPGRRHHRPSSHRPSSCRRRLPRPSCCSR